MTAPLIVLGSANRDYTVVVDRHPLPGETLLGGDIAVGTGGKGANQAVAAARAGVVPVLIGAVGSDSTGRGLLFELAEAGVDVSRVRQSTDAPTGVALITVDADGENTIVVAAGANSRLTADDASRHITELVEPGSVLLAQLEIPLETVSAAALTATSLGARFVLNLSPSQPVPAELLALCDPLVVNESEASAVARRPVDSVADALAAATALLEVCPSVVITLGGDGAVAGGASGVEHFPAARVPVVDTTGAGDAFVGALAASLSDGADLAVAVRSGIAAGAFAVQYPGAQPPKTA